MVPVILALAIQDRICFVTREVVAYTGEGCESDRYTVAGRRTCELW